MKRLEALPLREITLLLLLLAAAATVVTGEEDIVLDCLIESYMEVELSTSASGIIDSITVDRGDLVREGQVLVILDSRVEKATVELARAEAKSTAEIESKEASLQYATKKLLRSERLFREGTITDQDLERTETEVALARAELAKAKEAKRIAELELKRTEALLSLRTIPSPITGVVVERVGAPGESINPSRTDAILKLSQIDPLNVEIIAPVGLYGRLKKGDRVEIRPESPVGGTYYGNITIVDRVIDAASGTFGVRVELPNPDHLIPAGLKCRATFLGD